MEDKDNRTEAELIKEAIEVQDACNLSGVVHSFSRSISRLWQLANEKGEGTTWVNRHRISRLYADKILSLAGEIQLNDFDKNY